MCNLSVLIYISVLFSLHGTFVSELVGTAEEYCQIWKTAVLVRLQAGRHGSIWVGKQQFSNLTHTLYPNASENVFVCTLNYVTSGHSLMLMFYYGETSFQCFSDCDRDWKSSLCEIFSNVTAVEKTVAFRRTSQTVARLPFRNQPAFEQPLHFISSGHKPGVTPSVKSEIGRLQLAWPTDMEQSC